MSADEFEVIRTLFAPHAGEGARGLVDDAALLERQGALVVTTDAIGVAAISEEPRVIVEEGGGAVVEVQRRSQLAPGLVRVTVRLGPEQDVDNVFLIRCGAAEARAYITGL